MTISPDFTPDELHRIREMLVQRYQTEVGIELADCDLAVGEGAPTSRCPTVFWHQRDANFVVFKLGLFCFRTQFFYTPHEQYGTGIEEFHDLDQCVAAVLQTQADHERERAGIQSGTTGDALTQAAR